MTNLSDKKALIILTSIDHFPGTDHKTGYYMDEMATPYYALRDAGAHISFASIAGGKAPIDPGSLSEENQRKPNVRRFFDDPKAMSALDAPIRVDAADAADYDAVFLPGGHGTMWDFSQSPALAVLIGRAFDQGIVVGAVCHGPAGLVSARRANGEPVVKSRRVNSFTDAEETAVSLHNTVPYLLETALRNNGAIFESAPNFQAHAVRDGNLITGQNPASVMQVADLLVKALG